MTFNYGFIGNCKTAALVSNEGSIDWACFPRFDSPSAFAKLLDEKKGGSAEIKPVGKYNITQQYIKNTNVLETRFKNRSAEFVVYDFMPRFRRGERIEKLLQIVRYIKVIKGKPKARITFNPKMGYAAERTSTRKINDYLMAKGKKDRFYLYSDLPLDDIRYKKPIELSNEHFVIMTWNEHLPASLRYTKLVFTRTCSYWRDFVKLSTLPRGYKESVIRSILALKLMTHVDGAVIAAPTTSLPEIVGEERNWDYRYCWLRDASFTIDALTKICHFDEADDFIEWITKICNRSRKGIQIMYKVDGERKLTEKILKHLAGYRNSKPVRIGNKAYIQKQNDIYGEVIEAFYLFFNHYNYKNLEARHWKVIQTMVQFVIKRWQEPDSGLWEFRGANRHFTFSKLMCWVAMDRAVKMAKARREDRQLIKRWTQVRNDIRTDILKKAWNPKVKAFTQTYDNDALDASNLLMPYFGFLPATHPKMRSTIEQSNKILRKGEYVFRYVAEDDFGKPKNAFTICTFWLIDALYLSGKKKEAKQLFSSILSKGNYLGLYSEDINIRTGELTGNFPQAYTHLAIVNTATLLSSAQLRRAVCNIRIEMLKD